MNNLVKLLAAIVLNLLLIQGAFAHSTGDSHDHGLGNYGTDGVIDRSLLPSGIAERVSDQSIEMAQSPEFAEVRANWAGEGDFVWQIHYQLKFRANTDYLSTKPSHLSDLLNSRPNNLGIERLGLYMTESEAQEFERRQELGDRIREVRAALGEYDAAEGEEQVYGPNFAGVWQDQMDGGAIVVALVDPSLANRRQLESLVGGSNNLRIIKVKYSWGEVNSYRDKLLNTFKANGLQAAARINSTSKGRVIEVVSPKPALISRTVFSVAPADLVFVTEGSVDAPMGAPNTTHSEAEQQPGLRIELDPGGWCTWGVNGHTSNWNYLVTAGHCGGATFDNFVGWTDDLEIHQNNSFHLTPGSQFVHSIRSEPYDMKRMSTPQADSNCYHAVGNCIRNVRWRALHNSWEVGSDIVCASLGNSAVYQCGVVLEENYTSNGAGCEGSRWVRFDIAVIGGDSGSGFIGPVASPDVTIDAILACQSGSASFGNTAYDVKTQLGFDFNCASTPVTGRAASAWGACPTYDR